MKIHPVLIMIAPAVVLVASVLYGADSQPAQQTKQPAQASAGRTLFLRNCAHCHGADAHGDEGPDLHDLDWTDQEITARIRHGKKGQMTAFDGKLQTNEIKSIIAYLRTLK